MKERWRDSFLFVLSLRCFIYRVDGMIFFSVFVFDMIMIWVVLVFVVNFVLGLGLILSFVNVSWFYINLLFKIDFLLLN